ncbi:MAG TPA: lytic transglycosylase domain-containing protein [Acetobacteraceae bacterium]|nr:lytic transglycosylase domain-containing protein [Acetobacteraceae bacterium]
MQWALLLLLSASPAAAEPQGAFASCEAAIRAAQAAQHLPTGLLSALALVESGRPDPRMGTVRPWPWTINVEGQGLFFANKASAVAAVQVLQASGIRSIDVGCLQVNLLHHPAAFASLEQAFDPTANARYAARFLAALHDRSQDWMQAAGDYHSQTPTLGAAYRSRVLARWHPPGLTDRSYAAFAPSEVAYGDFSRHEAAYADFAPASAQRVRKR